MEIIKLPKMSPFEERVWEHIKNRKTPLTASQVAKYFICSQSKASAALKFFEASELVEIIKVGTTKYYKAKNG